MLNVNVKCKCKCSVFMSDRQQNIIIFTVIHSFQSHYKGYLAGKSEDVDHSGHLRAVQPTQLRSPSNTDHTTIARQRYLEKKITFWEPVIPLLHPLIFLFLEP